MLEQQQQAAPVLEQQQPALQQPPAPPCFNWAAAPGASNRAYLDKAHFETGSTGLPPPAGSAAPKGGRDGTVRLDSLEFNTADLQALLWPDSTKQTEVGAIHRTGATCCQQLWRADAAATLYAAHRPHSRLLRSPISITSERQMCMRNMLTVSLC